MDDLQAWQYVLIALLFMWGGFVRASLGFGGSVLTLPFLLSGSIILEQIFAWPGIGKLFFESVTTRDYPVMMGLMLMFSTMTLAGQLLADLLYAWIDPRVTYQ